MPGLLDRTLSTAAENLALDEALLLQADAGAGGEVLRFWEWPEPAVVLGAGGRLAEDVNEEACRADAVPILRRASGGGTVLLGSGCLVYTLVLSYQRDPALREIASSYAYILERIRTALADLLPAIEPAGTSDLAAAGLKFSGNSQQRKRDYLLHHGTLLYRFDLGLFSRYLRMPARQPDYRRGRRHEEFVRNLPTTADDLRRRLCSAWNAETEISELPMGTIQQLIEERHGRVEWIRRR